VESPSYDTARFGSVPVVDAVATWDEEASAAAVFLVNRSQDEAVTITIDLTTLGDAAIVATHTLSDDDLDATNSLEQPERVGLVSNTSASMGDGVLTIELPPVSWTAIELAR
jgi:alpha-N-arabinofuranosidase